MGNNNDTRGSSLGFYLVPSIRTQVQKNSLTFSGTTLLNKLISCGDLPVDFKRSGANKLKKILRKMKSRINKDVIMIFTWLYLINSLSHPSLGWYLTRVLSDGLNISCFLFYNASPSKKLTSSYCQNFYINIGVDLLSPNWLGSLPTSPAYWSDNLYTLPLPR